MRPTRSACNRIRNRPISDFRHRNDWRSPDYGVRPIYIIPAPQNCQPFLWGRNPAAPICPLGRRPPCFPLLGEVARALARRKGFSLIPNAPPAAKERGGRLHHLSNQSHKTRGGRLHHLSFYSKNARRQSPILSAAQHVDGDAEEIGKFPKVRERRLAVCALPLAHALLCYPHGLAQLPLRDAVLLPQCLQIFRKFDFHKKSLQLFL